MKPSRSLICVLFAVLLAATPAQAWWNGAWSSRRKITIDTSATGAAITDPIGTVTVLVRLHDGDLDFDGAKPDGSDLRFVAADDKTVLTSQIEKYDSLLDQAFIWVRIPDLPSGAKTVVYLYYGNGKSAAPANDDKNNYDSTTSLVYHFAENGGAPQDSTGNGNNAQNGGAADLASLIGSGLSLTGTTPITIPASPSLNWAAGDALTWSAWIKFPENQPNAILFSRQDEGGSLTIGVDNGIPYVEIGGQRSTATGAALAVGSWKHLTMVVSGSVTTLYVDGASYATLAAGLPALNSASYLGGDGSGGAGWRGSIDELEISKAARPAGFLKLTTINQGADSDSAGKMLAVGPVEQSGSWLTSWFTLGYFGIILSSVTIDGWVVIFVLVVMGVLSWRVNISKLKYLNALREADAEFMKAWVLVGTDLTVLEEADRFRNLAGRVEAIDLELLHESSLYRIYHIGAEEIRKRLVSANRNSKILSAQSIEAIRASLHGGFEKEAEEIDNDLVYMKVAIAGGPFIGLLGTVVGVMITFAAIAAAGDVNVNAIAPGISAALVATAAGLLVAIPAMFGYNYLVSRIKRMKTRMRVFIDEFVSKLAEFYRPQKNSAPKGEEAYVDAN
jgi:biopolymer transport protein ExbB